MADKYASFQELERGERRVSTLRDLARAVHNCRHRTSEKAMP